MQRTRKAMNQVNCNREQEEEKEKEAKNRGLKEKLQRATMS
jgi:hypothetical protein